MPTLGTKKFWKPAPGASPTQKENQILKNSGYINIQLVSVNYLSKGNFWQKIFGGKDNIALATNLSYQTGVDTIEASSVQDQRTVKVDNKNNFGLSRNIAVKIPANANALSMAVRMTAVKDDLLQAKFDMLNKPEYQSALQLAPVVVGQVLTITSLVKKLFTDSDPQSQLDATFAGIISVQPEDNPVQNMRLTRGFLIMVATDDGEPFTDADESNFEVRGESLYYNTKEVLNTYAIFNVSFDAVKGDDENSIWFKKYNEALNNLDHIHATVIEEEQQKILNDAKRFWIEGNALLDADTSYINSEKVKIKGTVIRLITEKYKDLTKVESAGSIDASVILEGLNITDEPDQFSEALPETQKFLNQVRQEADAVESTETGSLSDHSSRILQLMEEDTDGYLKLLKKNQLSFQLKDGVRGPALEGIGLQDARIESGCDDFMANDDENRFEAATCTELPQPWTNKRWRVAESLKALIAQVNALAPARNKKSDGAIGDLAHAQRGSDHNPWVLDVDRASGIVTAIDITHDPARGCDCNALAKSLQNARDRRVKYVIWNKQIMSSTVNPWTWRPYSGTNPHNHHLHISVECDRTFCDARDKWAINVK